MEFTLLGAAALAVFGVWAMLRWEGPRGNAARCTGSLWDTALVAIVAGIFVGRIVAMVGDGINPLVNPAAVLLVRGGVSTAAASATTVAAFAWSRRRELLASADGIAAAALAGLAGWQGGCIVRGACLGTPSALPWAVAQEGSTVTRHPVELYAAVAYLGAAVAMALWKQRGRPMPGSAAATAVAVAGAVRLVTEPLRPSLGGGPVWWYVLAVVAGVGGLVLVRRRSRIPG